MTEKDNLHHPLHVLPTSTSCKPLVGLIIFCDSSGFLDLFEFATLMTRQSIFKTFKHFCSRILVGSLYLGLSRLIFFIYKQQIRREKITALAGKARPFITADDGQSRDESMELFTRLRHLSVLGKGDFLILDL